MWGFCREMLDILGIVFVGAERKNIKILGFELFVLLWGVELVLAKCGVWSLVVGV